MDFFESLKKLWNDETKKNEPPKQENKSTVKKLDPPKLIKSGGEVSNSEHVAIKRSGKSEKLELAPVPKDRSKDIPNTSKGAPKTASAVEDPKKAAATLDAAANSQATKSLTEKLFDTPVPQSENIADNSPERLNIDSANRVIGDAPEYSNKRSKLDQYATRDRTDLSPLFGYLSSVSDGKFKDLATSYKPPESADEEVEKMMGSRQEAQSQRDTAEHRKANSVIQAYEAQTKPITTIHNALISALNSGAKSDSAIVRTLLDNLQKYSAVDATNQQRYLSSLGSDTTKTNIANANIRQRATEFQASLMRKNEGKAAKDDLEDHIANRLVPVLYPNNRKVLHPDKKQWGSREQRIMGNAQIFIDGYAHKYGLINENSTIEDIKAARRTAVEKIIAARNHERGDFSNDPDVQSVFLEVMPQEAK